ncbi:DUF3572 domain-containing protein [Frigidibacter sp. MR17.24]|uniref:DUF3572 domain-containing protein n=1 Tax=Frigidibacter sp. MR17.24 TaxID=3127345 RepID=UPI003012E138
MARDRSDEGAGAAQRAAAESLAVAALGWLAGQGDPLRDFMVATGSGPDEIRARAADPEFLAAVLDFLMQEDGWVLGFAADHGLRPEQVAQARARLPGGDQPYFT